MNNRVTVDGKHLSLNGRSFRVKGVTYGSFAPRLDGELFPERIQIKHDLMAIEAAGLNTVRTYTLPPIEMVDLAAEFRMKVLVGLHYEDWRYETSPGRNARRRVLDKGRRAVAEAMERCADHPEVLAIVVGNEVPADIVRLHGADHVEDMLAHLIDDVHEADEGMLATYANFPTTEYLDVAGQDLVCFNVFLEQRDAMKRYLRHLQVVAADRPLVLGELGLAGAIHGDAAQAQSLGWQLRLVDEVGCAGATVYSWTDEWGVDGEPVEGWGFGITSTDRTPKQALDVVTNWAASSTRDLRPRWPKVSVVVCAYNGDQLIEKCLRSLQHCDYPELEVIVCDDGSTDQTADIARGFPFKLLKLRRGGLSAARNAGIAAATGEIVAFLDADAFCHPEWPYHLALSLEDDNVVATGGPNLPVVEARFVERAVSLSPGSPVEVLLTDDRAEHVPGCNMAYRKNALEEIGGFDPVYTAAGDDVDVCWKLIDRGYEIGFSPAAQVRHHRRDSVRGYSKQQRGYGRAERLLQARHPHRFNRFGQARWSGFIYGGLRVFPRLLRPVVYHGAMGTAPFQPVARRPSELVIARLQPSVPLALLLALLAAPLTLLTPWAWPVVAIPMAFVVAIGVGVASAVPRRPSGHASLRLRLLVAALHVAQPVVRLWGRLRTRSLPPRAATEVRWTGEREQWLSTLEQALLARRCRVRRGADADAWDLEISRGPLACARVAAAVLWHWTPVARLRHRPAPLAVGALLAGGLVAVWLPGLGITAVAIAAFSLLLDAVLLRRILQEVLTVTTNASRHG